jgi:four helix bundle protein
LRVYHLALEFLDAVVAAQIADTTFRDHARRSAKSTALNIAEGAGRVTRADKARCFTHARGECGEAASAVEIAARSGDASHEDAERVVALADEIIAMLTGLIR